MDSLAWGDAVSLRAGLISALGALPAADQARRSVDLALAVRFRRTASLADSRVPRDYAYAVDIALPSAAPEQIQDLLDSRKPEAPVRYDIVRARLWMPAGLSATVAAATRPVALDQKNTTSAAAPMLLELVTNTGVPTFGQTADNVAEALGVVDLVRSLSPSTLAATPMDVIVGLTNGVNRDYALWTPRPANLFRTLELPMALLRALDGITSPCAVIARAHRLYALQDKEMPRIVDYQPVLESALPPQARTATASVTLNVSRPTILRLKTVITPGAPAQYGFSETTGTAGTSTNTFALDNPIATTAQWDPALVLNITGTKAYENGALVLEHTDPVTDQKIVADATNILANLMLLRAPSVTTDKMDLSQLLLVRIHRSLQPYLPAAVIEEFITLVVGRWSYYFMTRDFELPSSAAADSPFWFHFAYTLVLVFTDTPPVLRLSEISRRPATVPTPFTITNYTWRPDTNQHADYVKLARAVVYFLLPVYGRQSA